MFNIHDAEVAPQLFSYCFQHATTPSVQFPISAAKDAWALEVLLFELLTSAPPFQLVILREDTEDIQRGNSSSRG